jgi:death-on-curing protein
MVKLLKFESFIKENNNIKTPLITLEDVLEIQRETINNFGGRIGVRDMNQLMSCIDKIYMSVFGEDAYPSLFDKAAAFFEGFINTHPLLDGNKRTAFEGLLLILNRGGYKLLKTYNQSRPFIINIVEKRMSIEQISRWIKRNSKEDKISGGLGDKQTINSLSKKHNVSISYLNNQLNKGIKIEREHTTSDVVAKEIAIDHLTERPDYYDQLEKIEKK